MADQLDGSIMIKRCSLIIAVLFSSVAAIGRPVAAKLVCERDLSTGDLICFNVEEGTGSSDPNSFADPPAVQEDRCKKTAEAAIKAGVDPAETYPILITEGHNFYQTADLVVGGSTGSPDLDSLVGSVGLSTKTVQTHQYWSGGCVNAAGVLDTSTIAYAWVRIVSAENLIGPLWVEVRGQITPMTQSWPTVSPLNNWQMVKVPLEIRGDVPSPISRSASASNVTGTLSVSITATPVRVIFWPGDGSKNWVECPVEAMSWPIHQPENPSSCSYAYRKSSVNFGGAPMPTETVTVWSVEASDPSINGDYPMTTRRDLLVAEVQALVTG